MTTQAQAGTMVRLNGRMSPSLHSLKRLFQGDLTQRFSRFLWVRQSYSLLKGIQQRFTPTAPKRALLAGSPSVLSPVSVATHVKAVHRDGVSLDLALPDAMVTEILDHGLKAPCMEPGYGQNFLLRDLAPNNHLADGHRVIRALVQNLGQCQAINKLAQDSLLLQIADSYLGYFPSKITCHLTWSLACDLPEEEIKKQYPPTNFHYDIAGYNFVTAYFYITSVCNDSSGHHTMIKGSHTKKPLWMLLKSGRHSDESVYSHYDSQHQLDIKGKAGAGFFQDPSCFHKIKVPRSQNRLLFQVRYS